MSVWMVETLLATTLLMALVMLLRRPVARWLGAGTAYALWALPVARLILPAIPQDMASPSPLHSAVDQAGLPDLLMPASAAALPSAPSEAAAFPWLELAFGLWLTGAILFLLVQAIGYVRFRRLVLREATVLEDGGRIMIVTSPRVSGPLAFGVFHPVIALPVDFSLRYDDQEQMMAIAHERAHHERGDLAANMAALGLLALHWCNPIAWIAYRAYRADQELACDARVLALYGQDHAHAYGRAILKAASGGRQFAAACHLTRLTSLKGRLKMLSSHAVSLHRISWGMAAVALVTSAGLVLTASGSRAAQQVAAITDSVQDMKLSRLADIGGMVIQPAAALEPTAPAPPPAPEAPVEPAEPSLVIADIAPPPAPPAPPTPTADMAPPVPPVPPAPSVSVRSEKGRIIVKHADGRVETHRVPTDAEIRRMVPHVDVRDGCEGGDMVSHSEKTGADGRKTIRVRICQAAIDRQARAAERAGADAERIARDAERMAARAERQGKAAALAALRIARRQVAALGMIPADDRADALRDIDEEIANMQQGDD
ncbi:beta-lactamase regulating signal transducer with metallopeptidase domain [Sphingobium fontiphilum]|uniref:Beta-lactamase regulating signal transducer with metallopeptidase domain n=1 Tax=Sphingobium fontiphilum TaxID=944425 RepID=A0A7W6GPP0_9SPHN|nr:M56 family metallopeptidase [Sphingobium fontiphilum]MBB3983566.1 beta-lactamase regulating signal transducer with metallopeptidase domain [Sphingobium fontiphilum]